MDHTDVQVAQALSHLTELMISNGSMLQETHDATTTLKADMKHVRELADRHDKTLYGNGKGILTRIELLESASNRFAARIAAVAAVLGGVFVAVGQELLSLALRLFSGNGG